MKKFFTVLGVAALTAMASQAEVASFPGNPQLQGFKKNPIELMQANKVSEIQDLQAQKRVIRREWVSGNYTYTLTIQNYARVIDIVKFRFPTESGGFREATFEDLPYYFVAMNIGRYQTADPSRNPSDITLMMTWPSIAAINPTADQGKDFPDLTPENSVIAPVELLASQKNSQYDATFINFDFQDPKYAANNYLPNFDAQGNFLGWPQCTNQTGFPLTVNGQQNCKVINNGGQNSYLQILSAKDDADMQTTNIKMEMNMYYAPQDDDTQIMGVTGTYDGLANTYNMQLFNATYDVNEFHLFNAGMCKFDGENEEQFVYPFGTPDVESFEPVQEYYMLALPAPLTLGFNVQDYGEVKGFNGRQIGVLIEDEKEAQNSANFKFLRGAFWTPGESFENERYSVKMPEIYTQEWGGQVFETLCANPEPNIMLPSGYTSEFGYWPESAGTTMYWVGYGHFPIEGSYLAFNTKDGIVFNGDDKGGNTYHMAYKGKVIYHYDPENMLNTREIGPFVGDFDPDSGVNDIVADSNFTLSAANGVINVASEGENIRVFDLSGALVGSAKGTASFNVNKGLYIVVVGKTAKKVIL